MYQFLRLEWINNESAYFHSCLSQLFVTFFVTYHYVIIWNIFKAEGYSENSKWTKQQENASRCYIIHVIQLLIESEADLCSCFVCFQFHNRRKLQFWYRARLNLILSISQKILTEYNIDMKKKRRPTIIIGPFYFVIPI